MSVVEIFRPTPFTGTPKELRIPTVQESMEWRIVAPDDSSQLVAGQLDAGEIVGSAEVERRCLVNDEVLIQARPQR